MDTTIDTRIDAPHRLEHFPVALFASVMGIAGLAIAWLKAAQTGVVPEAIGGGVRWLASGLFAFLLLVYVVKLLRHPAAVLAERTHPLKQNFFPAISIGVLLLSIAWAHTAPATAQWLWNTGAALHLIFTLLAMSGWIHHTHFEIKHVNPAWFIPVVGNILVPVVGASSAHSDISWFFFSIGLIFWLVLLTIVLYRLFFHEPLPVRLTPTLFILLAPPSVGFLAYLALTDSLDAFARILYFTALFLGLLLTSNAARFFRVPFFISAWAYSFPLAALTLATFEMAARTGLVFYGWLAWTLLVLLSSVVAILAGKTVMAAFKGRICVPE
ncbi:SLAC1 anion channel family protein [Stutzerimonas stutzeri]|uniref:SLAC1 anion channel family protein n=1 Tax=Stutzerimonas sp. S1 TaxID=3030652 RepID=UPI0022240C95|nr:SLAC1 anion channel family protein [Stutzerimonas sp. S1]MCW3148126.1 SLAC1 anion channel family protein [Stutzerimonas sp. S1]